MAFPAGCGGLWWTETVLPVCMWTDWDCHPRCTWRSWEEEEEEKEEEEEEEEEEKEEEEKEEDIYLVSGVITQS